MRLRSGVISHPDDATFVAALMGNDEQPYLFSTNTGNGIITRLGELHSCARTGKAVLTVPKGAKPMIPCPIYDIETDWICCIHSNGNLLVFPASEVPEMARAREAASSASRRRSLQVKRKRWWRLRRCPRRVSLLFMRGSGIPLSGGRSWRGT